MDVRQALLDARVAEAADAWFADPRDVEVYRRLVSAVEDRRRAREGSLPDGAAEVAERSAQAASFGAPPGQVQSLPQSRASDDHSSLDDHSEDSPLGDVGSGETWPRVRAVGADLAGDPAAVLRRLRGG